MDHYVPESIGSGVAFLDFDGDGDMDIYAVDGAGNSGRLFRNDVGTFVDVTATSGLRPLPYGAGVAVGDFDNDGRADLYLTSVGAGALYRNTGNGFEDVTPRSGIRNDGWGTSSTWIDFDRDGWLDLYVANYLALIPDVTCADRSGAPEYCGPKAYPARPDRLYRNLGDGQFEDVTATAGIGTPARRGLGVAIFDVDRDGWTDVYVANDGEPNFLWRNRGDGTFEDVALHAGVAVNGAGQSEAGMGVALGDVDGDGWSDLFVTHLGGESNTLYGNVGEGAFVDETAARGLHGPSLPHTGFGTAFADLDNDGDLDLIVANGRINRGPIGPGTPPGPLQPYAEPNAISLNDGAGRFEPGSGSGFAARPGMSRGLAVGDIDDDGRLDVLVLETGRELRLFQNATESGDWIGFRVTEPALGDRDAIGARLEVRAAGVRRERYVAPNLGYLSSNDPRVHVGLGEVDEIDTVLVTWPDGGTEVFAELVTGRYNPLRRGEGARRP